MLIRVILDKGDVFLIFFRMDEISDEERTLIIKYADLDEDGKISLSDFRQMLDVKLAGQYSMSKWIAWN